MAEKKKKNVGGVAVPQEVSTETRRMQFANLTRPTAEFTRALAAEIVKNLTTIGRFTTQPFAKKKALPIAGQDIGVYPLLVDTSVLIDGRIVPIVNSGFLVGTLLIPEFVLGEVQHIADSSDSLRRAKGRRGLEAVHLLKQQKANRLVTVKVIGDDLPDVKEVDRKLATLAAQWQARLLTVDFNLAHVARAQNVQVLNINDLGQALKVAIVPGEEFTLKMTHAGRGSGQGVGYLSDGTMVVVDHADHLIGSDIAIVVTKIHQTPAGQLFFARLK